MKKPPPEAMSIVRCLRTEVPRPTELPEFSGGARVLRWYVDGELACPIGLHPLSERRDPDQYYKASRFLDRAVPRRGDDPDNDPHVTAFYAFMNWWDEQTNAAAAVAAIWPRTPQKTKEGSSDE